MSDEATGQRDKIYSISVQVFHFVRNASRPFGGPLLPFTAYKGTIASQCGFFVFVQVTYCYEWVIEYPAIRSSDVWSIFVCLTGGVSVVVEGVGHVVVREVGRVLSVLGFDPRFTGW